jgi:hypothetical protein
MRTTHARARLVGGAKDVERARGRWLAIAFRAAWPAAATGRRTGGPDRSRSDVGADAMRIAVSDKDARRRRCSLRADRPPAREAISRAPTRPRSARARDLARTRDAVVRRRAVDVGAVVRDAWVRLSSRRTGAGRRSGLHEGRSPSTAVSSPSSRRAVRAGATRRNPPWRGSSDPSSGWRSRRRSCPDPRSAYQLSWRNLARVDLALYSVDVARAVAFGKGRGEESASQWLATIDLTRQEKLVA